jgi:hypothetical protein
MEIIARTTIIAIIAIFANTKYFIKIGAIISFFLSGKSCNNRDYHIKLEAIIKY